VLETRISRAGSVDNRYGGIIDYRIDVHASWIENGAPQEAWIATTKTSADQNWLNFWLSQHAHKSCTVRRNPRNPSDMFAMIE
jgi:hypothetical protein